LAKIFGSLLRMRAVRTTFTVGLQLFEENMKTVIFLH